MTLPATAVSPPVAGGPDQPEHTPLVQVWWASQQVQVLLLPGWSVVQQANCDAPHIAQPPPPVGQQVQCVPVGVEAQLAQLLPGPQQANPMPPRRQIEVSGGQDRQLPSTQT